MFCLFSFLLMTSQILILNVEFDFLKSNIELGRNCSLPSLPCSIVFLNNAVMIIPQHAFIYTNNVPFHHTCMRTGLNERERCTMLIHGAYTKAKGKREKWKVMYIHCTYESWALTRKIEPYVVEVQRVRREGIACLIISH